MAADRPSLFKQDCIITDNTIIENLKNNDNQLENRVNRIAGYMSTHNLTQEEINLAKGLIKKLDTHKNTNEMFAQKLGAILNDCLPYSVSRPEQDLKQHREEPTSPPNTVPQSSPSGLLSAIPLDSQVEANFIRLQNFMKDLQSLSPSSSEAKLQQLQQELSHLKEWISEEDYHQIDSLISSFSQYSNQYKPEKSEWFIFHFLAKKKPELKNCEVDFVALGRKKGLLEMESVLKNGSWYSLTELAQQVREKNESLAETLPIYRFQNLPSQFIEDVGGEKFLKNIGLLNKEISNAITDTLLPQIENAIKPLEETWPKEFQALLDKCPSLKLSSHKETFVDVLLLSYEKKLEENWDIVTGNEASLKNLLEQTQKKLEGIIAPTVKENYQRIFMERHLWVIGVQQGIKQLYDQSEEHHTNLGSGVCFQNSLQRTGLLLKNPEAPSTTIQMGSSQQSRFHHLKLRKMVQAEKPKNIQEVESASAYTWGLQESKQTQRDVKGYQNLLQGLSKAHNSSQNQIILGIYESDGGAHALNLQLGPIYRILDDNFGIVEFADFDTLKSELETYLKAFYPTASRFSIEIYEPL